MNFTSPNRNHSAQMSCFEPPSIISIPCRIPRDACLPMFTEDDSKCAPKITSLQPQGISEMGMPKRWLPDHKAQSVLSLPRCPLRQASIHIRNTASDDGSCSSHNSSDSEYSSLMSDCEQLSIEIQGMLNTFRHSRRDSRCSTDRQSVESSTNAFRKNRRGSRSSTGRQSVASSATGNTSMRPRLPCRCSTDLQSLRSATLPRRPKRQKSLDGPVKRWSACTADGSSSTLSESCNSIPQMPRRQNSNV